MLTKIPVVSQCHVACVEAISRNRNSVCANMDVIGGNDGSIGAFSTEITELLAEVADILAGRVL